MPHGLARSDIARVHDIIAPYIRQTPVLHVSGRDVGLGSFPLTLKLEFTQHAGSFKARGAFANLLTRPIPSSGVVAASGGNHGVAVAYAAMRLGIAAKIFVPTVSSPVKVAGIRAYGADVVITGDRYADALDASERYLAETQAMPVHARVVIVEDDDIVHAQDVLWDAFRLVVEPGGPPHSPPSLPGNTPRQAMNT
jgi:threonine dehydratase